MNSSIEQLKKEMANAKMRQAEASKDVKRIEKDMNDFNNNKDNKLAELQSSLDSLKKGLNKNSAAVKTLQKELQNARLDSEQAASDFAAAEEQLAEIDAAIKAQQEELEALQREQVQVKVRGSYRI